MSDYNLGSAHGTISLDYDGTGVDQAQSGIEKVATTVGKFALGAVAGIGVVTAAVAGLALKGGFSRALDIQDAQQKLLGLGHSAAEITEIMNDALASVKGTAYGLGDAATVAASAVAAGIKPGQELTQYLKTVADSADIAGVSFTQMGAIFTQVTATGKAYNGQLEQLADQGIPIYQFLAKELHTTADAITDMASKGQISSAEFAKALADNIGGAAQSSGDTARGAFANVEAALSRLGIVIAGPAVADAPKLFVAIEKSVDSLTAALAPYGSQLQGVIDGFFSKLTKWISDINWAAVIQNIQNFFNAFKTGDFGSFGSTVQSIVTIVQPMGPLLVAVAKALGGIASSVGQVLATGISLLPPILNAINGALQWLAQNPTLVSGIFLAIAAAVLVYKAAQLLANAAALASIPVEIARATATLASAAANQALAKSNFALAAAIDGNTASEGANILATKASVLTQIDSRAAVVLSTAANKASAIALGVSTAATKLFGLAQRSSTGAIIANTAATEAAAAAAPLLAAGEDAVTASAVGMDVALDANPIGLIVLAIVLAIAVIAALAYGITQLVIHWQDVMNFFATVGQAIANFFIDGFNTITKFVASWPVTKLIIQVIQTMIAQAQAAFKIFGDIFANVASFINTVFVIPFQNFIAGLVAVFQWFGGVVQGVINGIIAFVTPFVQFWITYVVPLIQAAINLLAAIFNYIWLWIQFIFQSIFDFVSGIVTAVVNWIVGQWTAMVATIQAIFQAIYNFVAPIFQAIYDFIAGIVQGVVNFIVAIWGGIVKAVSPVLTPIISFVSGIFQSIYNAVAAIVRSVVNFIVSTWNTIAGIVGPIFNNVKNAIVGAFDNVGKWLGQVKDNIVNFFKGAVNWLVDAGKNIINGLIKGVENGLSGLTNLLNSITAMIPKTKGPPEKDKVLLTPAGESIMDGLIAGIAGKAGDLAKLLSSLSMSIAPTFGAPLTALDVAGTGASTTTDARQFTYVAAPGSQQLSGEEELFSAMRTAKVVVPGW